MAPFAYAETATPVSPSATSAPTSSGSGSAVKTRPTTTTVEPTPTPSTAKPAATSTDPAPSSADPTKTASKPAATESSATTTADPTPTGAAPSKSSVEPAQTASPTVPEATDASPTPKPRTAQPSESLAARAAAVAPIYGIPKIRVGVQVADGSYVPDGTTTNGSTFSIVETGPGTAGQPTVHTCTTGTVPEGELGLTFCPGQFFGVPGDTFTVTQLTAPAGFVVASQPAVFGPCEVQVANTYCGGGGQDVVLSDGVVPPTATDDDATVDNTESVNAAVLANDDTQGAPILSLEVTEPASHGETAVTLDGPQPRVSYTPDPGFVGTDSFGYTYETVNGSATGTVTVTVTGKPLAPTATDDEVTVDNTASVDVAVVANDNTQGEPILSLEVSEPAVHGDTVVSTDPDHHVTYTPDAGFVGTDTFGYTYQTANGSATGTVTVTVTGETLPPAPNYGFQKVRIGVQIADGAYVPEGTTTAGTTVTLTKTGLAENSEPQTSECVTGEPTSGSTVAYCPTDVLLGPGETLKITQTSVGADLVLNPTPIVIPPCAVPVNAEAAGIVALPTCETKDAIIIDAVVAPTAANDDAAVDNTATVDVAVLGNDDTQGAPIQSVVVSQSASHGAATVNADDPVGTIRYVPTPGFVGTDSFGYTYLTANGSASATVTITVTGQPLAPTAGDDEAAVDNTASVDVPVLANDNTLDEPILFVEVTQPASNGYASVNADDPNHTIRYTPNAGFVGTDTFGYTYSTASGSATGTVTVTVTGEALPPVPSYGFQKVRVGVQIADGSYVPEGTSTAGSTVTLVRTGLGENAEPQTSECTTGVAEAGSSVSYCPQLTLAPGETLQVTQATAGADLVLNITPIVVPPCTYPVNDIVAEVVGLPTCDTKDAIISDLVVPPTAADDEATVDNTESVNVAVLANDGTQGAPILSLEVTQAAAHGYASVNADDPDHTIHYTPAPGFAGTDSFSYTYTTANGSATGTVNLTVTGDPLPNYGIQKVRVGVRIADGAYVPPGTSTAGTTVRLVRTGPGGTNPQITDCTTNTPDPGTTTTYCPGEGGFFPGSFFLFPGETLTATQLTAQPGLALNPTPIVIPPCVNPMNDRAPVSAEPPNCGFKDSVIIDGGLPPTATDDNRSVDNQDSVDVEVLANDHTQGAPVLSLAVSEQPGHGTAEVSGEGFNYLVRYTPAAGYIGRDSFDYTYRTANGSATATVTVGVTGRSTPTPTSPAPPPPISTSPAAPPSSSDPDHGGLARTGGPAGAGLGAGFGLLLSVAGAALLSRRRRAAGRHV